MSYLSRKLEDDPARPAPLVTEWGGGYALAAEVSDDGPPSGGGPCRGDAG